jgi:hypothetical protein
MLHFSHILHLASSCFVQFSSKMKACAMDVTSHSNHPNSTTNRLST